MGLSNGGDRWSGKGGFLPVRLLAGTLQGRTLSLTNTLLHNAWAAGQNAPVLILPSMPVLQLDPALSPAQSAVA
jgi:hypothetical protein